MELKVFISSRKSVCDECGAELGRHAWITLLEDKGALCLPCADLDHLVFLPSGNAAMTRRSKKYSTLWTVVLQWSRARKRYERQGLLVEEAALQQAEQECLADADLRDRRRRREGDRRTELNSEYVQQFAAQVHKLFPHCPAGREQVIAEHACQKYSGRVGRSAEAKALDEEAILLAVIAHIRHAETDYDKFLTQGWERSRARAKIRDQVDEILESWKRNRYP